jgi:hypothetical protein
MLDKRYLIPLTLLISISLASYDFFLFNKIRAVFYIHTLATLVIGSSLFYFSLRLIKRKSGNLYINIFTMIAGIVQFSIHLTLLIIGRCS